MDRARRLISREWDKGCHGFLLSQQLAPLLAAERSQGTEVRADVPRELVVLANPEQTYEIVATLLDNARRHAPGSPVTVSAEGQADEVIISVADWGPGFPPGVAEKMFTRGWTTSAKGEGMGIGLYLARKLSEEQGGKLTASNRVGGGACFSLTLPAGEISPEAAED
jgi:signal transduction histidine kinase